MTSPYVACKQKYIWTSKRAGWDAALYVLRRHGEIVTPYKCVACGKYHLSSARQEWPPKHFALVEDYLGAPLPEVESADVWN